MQKLPVIIHGILPASVAGCRRVQFAAPAGDNAGGWRQTAPGNETPFFILRQRPPFLAGAGMSSLSRPGSAPPDTCADSKARDKPEIDHRATLRNGLQVRVRRLQESDRELLERFLDSPEVEYQHPAGCIATVLMGAGKARDFEIGHYYAAARDSRCDVLIAEVDGKIEGLCDYAPIPIDGLEADDALLRQAGYYHDGVCISSMAVSMKGQGIGTALKKAQMDSARHLGYTAIMGKTRKTNAEMLGLVAKNSGAVATDSATYVWTATPIKEPVTEPITDSGGKKE